MYMNKNRSSGSILYLKMSNISVHSLLIGLLDVLVLLSDYFVNVIRTASICFKIIDSVMW